MELATDVECRLGEILEVVDRIEEDRAELMVLVEEVEINGVCTQGVSASVANAPYAYTPRMHTEKLVKVVYNAEKTIKRRVS